MSKNLKFVYIVLLLVPVALVAWSLSLYRNSDVYQNPRLEKKSIEALLAERRKGVEDPRLFYTLGKRFNEARKFEEAAATLTLGAKVDPNRVEMREELLKAQMALGQAQEAYQQALAYRDTHSQEARAHQLLGRFYFGVRAYDKARESLEKAVALDDTLADAHFQLAAILSSQKEGTAARQQAERAIALDPKTARYFLLLAALQAEAPLLTAQAEASFRQAITLAPEEPAAHLEYARFLLGKGKTPEQRKEAEHQAVEAQRLGVRGPAPLFIIGRARLYNGDYAGVIEPMQQVATMVTDDPGPALALAQAYRALKQPQEADRWQKNADSRHKYVIERNRLIQATTDFPNDPLPKRKLAEFYCKQGDVDNCVLACAKALNLSPESTDVRHAAAHELAIAGFAEKARPLQTP